ncbi:MAG: DUF4886 domain-containing protein [Clostridia bacterium]|nr:DUF4886 domain-containing protein [Clostridia bacterium]
MEYLWQIFRDGGYDTVYLGNLYIGGCSLNQHWSNMQSDAAAYTYYQNSNGMWSNSTASIASALAAQDWDVVTIQQASHDSGREASYNNLGNVLNFIAENKPNAKIYFHMTWAYQQSSTHSGFANYNNDQMTMYRAITTVAQQTVEPNRLVDGIIPSGTAVQNLRTSYLGDTLTRDGYHMSYDYGRYVTALTWYAYLSGGDCTDIDWVPLNYSYLSNAKEAICEAVKNAVATPFSVTASTHKTAVSDAILFAGAGMDIEDYQAISLQMTVGSFYDSRKGHTLRPFDASLSPKFAATAVFSKTELPAGAVIVVDAGYQYRPDGWVDGETLTGNAARPGNKTAQLTVIDSAWWGSFTLRGFNLSRTDGAAMTENDTVHLRIYVPKNAADQESPAQNADAALFEANGLDMDAYREVTLTMTVGAFYDSRLGYTLRPYDASLSPKYAATQIFSKTELPVGAVIVVDASYQYRPDGWVDGETLTGNAARPGNKTAQLTVVDSAWWGSFTLRGFNLSRTDGAAITENDTVHLRIYVPLEEP